ncbi:MAG TPA: hypothetical protein VI112_15880 [Bacteroidia bacterium]|jgi:hypothetical protein
MRLAALFFLFLPFSIYGQINSDLGTIRLGKIKKVEVLLVHQCPMNKPDRDTNNLKMEQVIPGKFSVNADNILSDPSIRYLEEIDRHKMSGLKRRDMSEGAVGDEYPVKFIRGYTLAEMSKGMSSVKVVEYYK